MARKDIIAGRYAKGLAGYAAETGEMDEVRRDIELLAAIFDSASGGAYVPELAAFLRSPLPTVEEKIALASSVTEKAGIGKGVADFLVLLIRKDRAELIPRIAGEFAEIAGRLTGARVAVAHTARPLTDEQERRLCEVLSSVFGGAVRIRQVVEPGLLAGAKIVIGDKTFDGTVLGRLEEMKHRLISRGIKDLETMRAGEDAGQATA